MDRSIIKIVDMISTVLFNIVYNGSAFDEKLRDSIKTLALSFKKGNSLKDYQNILKQLITFQNDHKEYFENLNSKKDDKKSTLDSWIELVLSIFQSIITDKTQKKLYNDMEMLQKSIDFDQSLFFELSYKFIETITLQVEEYENDKIRYKQISEIFESTLNSLATFPTKSDKFSDTLISIKEKIFNSKNLKDIKKLKNELISSIESIEGEIQILTKDISNELKKAQEKVKILEKKVIEEHNKAIKDPLTGAYNRKWLQNYLQEEFWFKKVENGSIMMLDLDHFKQVNDKYGHIFGDYVLKEVVKRIKSVISKEDYIVRYGGEEFLIFINSDIFSLEQIGKKILAEIRKNLFRYRGESAKVTTSIGGSFFSEKDKVDDLIELTDKKLYKAKNSGRDKLVITL